MHTYIYMYISINPYVICLVRVTASMFACPIKIKVNHFGLLLQRWMIRSTNEIGVLDNGNLYRGML